MEDPDLALLAAWKGGDAGAGDRLLAGHFDGVLRFFRSKLGDDVEDLVQRTFLDLLEAVADDQPLSFRAYLFTIARRRLLDHLRARYRPNADLALVTSLSVADLGTSPSGIVARGQQERALLAALRTLSVDHQVALELAYWEDLSGREIAQVLGIAEHTVRSRLARARDALREALERGADATASVATLESFDARARRAFRAPDAS